jgi:hypothetical protein
VASFPLTIREVDIEGVVVGSGGEGHMEEGVELMEEVGVEPTEEEEETMEEGVEEGVEDMEEGVEDMEEGVEPMEELEDIEVAGDTRAQDHHSREDATEDWEVRNCLYTCAIISDSNDCNPNCWETKMLILRKSTGESSQDTRFQSGKWVWLKRGWSNRAMVLAT